MEWIVIHACEQVLRFAQAAAWDELNEERKVQMAFNMGVMALGLRLTKEEGYDALVRVREGKVPTKDFREYVQKLVEEKAVPVAEEHCRRGY